MNKATVTRVVALGVILGLLLGAALFVPRLGSVRSTIPQNTPSFSSEVGEGATGASVGSERKP